MNTPAARGTPVRFLIKLEAWESPYDHVDIDPATIEPGTEGIYWGPHLRDPRYEMCKIAELWVPCHVTEIEAI